MSISDSVIEAEPESPISESMCFSSESKPAFLFDVSLSTAIAADGRFEARAPCPTTPLSPELLDKMHRYWRAANYLCIGQIYLFENPLLRERLTAAQIKPRLLGHWGTSPGQNLIYIHLNRLIKEHDADIIYISGPGHGGPSLKACSYLEGTYTEVHPEITHNEAGLRLMFRKFSTPGGVPSHCGPHVPNSMHEGGELGYVLTQTKIGNWIQASGGNPGAARARGVNVDRVKEALFVLSAAMASFVRSKYPELRCRIRTCAP